MKLKILAIIVLFIGGVVFLPTLSTATPLPIGDPILGDSWAQRFEESGVGNFSSMEAFMTSIGDAFEAPGFLNFNSAGWNGSLVRSDYIKATGSTLNWMQFDIKFTGASSDPLTFDFLAWDGGILREAAHASWNGSGWSFEVFTSSYNDTHYNRAVVPEPGILILLGISMASVAFARKKFKG